MNLKTWVTRKMKKVKISKVFKFYFEILDEYKQIHALFEILLDKYPGPDLIKNIFSVDSY